VVEGDRVYRGIQFTAGQKHRKGRGEAQAARTLREVERFDPEPVVAEHGASGVALDEAEGEHALQALDEALPPAVLGLQEDLGVAGREEAIAFL
jgi:hypothetical protein